MLHLSGAPFGASFGPPPCGALFLRVLFLFLGFSSFGVGLAKVGLPKSVSALHTLPKLTHVSHNQAHSRMLLESQRLGCSRFQILVRASPSSTSVPLPLPHICNWHATRPLTDEPLHHLFLADQTTLWRPVQQHHAAMPRTISNRVLDDQFVCSVDLPRSLPQELGGLCVGSRHLLLPRNVSGLCFVVQLCQ